MGSVFSDTDDPVRHDDVVGPEMQCAADLIRPGRAGRVARSGRRALEGRPPPAELPRYRRPSARKTEREPSATVAATVADQKRLIQLTSTTKTRFISDTIRHRGFRTCPKSQRRYGSRPTSCQLAEMGSRPITCQRQTMNHIVDTCPLA